MLEFKLDASNIIVFLSGIFERLGVENYLGENVSTADHMLQGAALAEKSGASEELIAAILLHDVGHFTSEFGTYSSDDIQDKYHDTAGGELLEPFFPQRVSECVRLHVAAKRYLCAKEPAYFDQLSKTSVHTLSLQGGPMSKGEVAEFETSTYYQDAVKVRKWDDFGKAAGVKTKTFSDYSEMLQNIVDLHCNSA